MAISSSSSTRVEQEREGTPNPGLPPEVAGCSNTQTIPVPASMTIVPSHPLPHPETQTQTLYIPTHPPPTPAPSPGPSSFLSLSQAQPTPPHQLEPDGLALYHLQPYPTRNTVALSGSDALSSLPTPSARLAFLSSLLTACTSPELLFLSQTIAPLLKRDFLSALPTELALHVLSFVEGPRTLARAAQVCRRWRVLVRDDGVWRRICGLFGFDGFAWEDEGLEEERRGARRRRKERERRRAILGKDQVEEGDSHEGSSFDSHMGIRRRPPDKYDNNKPALAFSWRRHFRSSYILRMNWRHGGTLLASHRLPIVAPDSGTVTSLALDGDWVVVGLSNSSIKIFSARTGVLARTLVGHESGVWGVCLVSAGGWLEEPDLAWDVAVLGEELDSLGGASGTSEEESVSERASEEGSVFVEGSTRRRRRRGKEGVAGSEEAETESEEESKNRTRTRMAPPGPGRPSNPCFSSSGWGQPNALVVSGGCDKALRVWDVVSGHCIYVLQGHTSTIRSLRVLHHRPIAVSGARDATLRVWDVQQGKCLRVLEGHQSSVRCLDVCGNRVVSGSYDATCRLWDIDTGQCIHVLQGHFHQVYSVAFDGVRIASGGLDTTVRIWSAETGQCLALLQGHTALVCQLQLSPPCRPRSRRFSNDATHTPLPTNPTLATSPSASNRTPTLSDPILATGGSDGRVITFSLRTYTPLHRIAAHDSSVTALQFSPSLGYLVTGGNDGRVRLFEVESGSYVREMCEPGECVWMVGFAGGSGSGGAGVGQGHGGQGGSEGEVLAIMCKRGGKTGLEIWSMGVSAGKYVKVSRRSASGKEREKEKERTARGGRSSRGRRT